MTFEERPSGAVMDNPRSDRVKSVRALSRRSSRVQYGKFLVEGPQAVREAAIAGALIDVYISTQAGQRHPDIAFSADEHGCYVHEVTDEVAQEMSPDGQGIIGVARLTEAQMGDEAFAPRDANGRPQLVAMFFEIRDPGNAGTVIRAADAAGASGVVFSEDSVDPFSPKVVRSSAGSIFHLPVVGGKNSLETIRRFRKAGWTVLAADGHGSTELYSCAALAEPTVWLFGNEARGLPGELLDAADGVVRIPLRGRAESLNLAMAATICLFESSKAMGEGAGGSVDARLGDAA